MTDIQTPPIQIPLVASRKSNKLGTAALVLGIISIATAFIPFLDYVIFIAASVGVLLGFLSLRAKSGPRGRGIAGLTVSAIGFVLTLIAVIMYSAIFSAVGPAMTQRNTSQIAPKASATQAPSPVAASKAPVQVQNPYDTKYGTFAPISASGSADDLITLPAGAKAGIITAKYTGSDNFIIGGIDATNQPTIDGSVNTIGNYSGTTAFGLGGAGMGAHSTQLKITATGPWTITVSPISAAPTGTPASGQGDSVFLYAGPATTWTIASNGSGNFMVNEYSDALMPGIGVNKIGATAEKEPVDPGPAVVELVSDGAWTIS